MRPWENGLREWNGLGTGKKRMLLSGVLTLLLPLLLAAPCFGFPGNNPPSITAPTGPLSFTSIESDAYHTISTGAVFSDADGQVWGDSVDPPSDHAELIISALGGTDLDGFALDLDGTGFTVVAFDLMYGGSSFGEISGGSGGAELRIKFHNGATTAEVQRVLDHILWRNTANTPVASRTIEFRIKDGGGGEAADTMVINVTQVAEAPYNRTDLVMTELDMSEIRQQFQAGPGWFYDRWPTRSFNNTSFDGDTRITCVVDDTGKDSFEGSKYELFDATRVSLELYVPQTWGAAGGAETGLWLHGYTDIGERLEFPVVFVRQQAGSPTPDQIRFYAAAAGSFLVHNIPLDARFDAWWTLSVVLDEGTLYFKVEGPTVGAGTFTVTDSVSGVTVTSLREVVLQSRVTTDSSQTYTVYFDNLTWNAGKAGSEVWSSLDVPAGGIAPIADLGVTYSDPTATLTTVLQTQAGVLHTSSGSGAVITGNGTGTLIITGTPDEINAALAGVVFDGSSSTWPQGVITITTTAPNGSSDTDTIELSNAHADTTANIPALDGFGVAAMALLLGGLVWLQARRRSRTT